MTEPSESTETPSSNDAAALSDNTPTDQSEAFICGEGQPACVAEAALQDGEMSFKSFGFHVSDGPRMQCV